MQDFLVIGATQNEMKASGYITNPVHDMTTFKNIWLSAEWALPTNKESAVSLEQVKKEFIRILVKITHMQTLFCLHFCRGMYGRKRSLLQLEESLLGWMLLL